MRFKIYIALLVCTLSSVLCTSLQAITPEEEQQFTYYWYAARQAIDKEDYVKAYTLLEFCRWIKPDDGTTLYQLGVIHQGLGNDEQARACFVRAYEVQKKGTRNENLLENLKRIYIAESDWKKALAMQDEIDACTEYDAFSALTRYRIYALWGKNKQAIKEIDRYLEYDPSNVRFLLFRLEIMEHIGAKPKELYAMYDKILAVDPFNLMVLNNYAYHLATHKGDLKEAERMSAITIRERPNNPVYLDTYGWILHLQGQDELAKFYLNKALQNVEAEHREEIQSHIDAIQ